MKGLYLAVSFMILLFMASCIEEYDLVMEDTGNEILIVEGHIIGGTECEFILQRSSCKSESYESEEPILIANASVYVICSNGQVFGCERRNDHHYYVSMGELDPDETYHLQIEIYNEGVYESEPMRPLPASALTDLSYTLSKDGETVQLRISNEDPHEEMYYLWTYDEHWEINTPLIAEWEYRPHADRIIELTQKTNRGWCSMANHPILLGNNLDYGNGALKNYALYSLSNLNNRFNTRYHTKVRQIAISKKEYEYYKQKEAQSTQTGGLFTLMPAQLPTNIHNDHGLRAEGYIGVHLNVSEAELYINSGDVGYKAMRQVEILPDSVAEKSKWSALYNQGYRVYRYEVYRNIAGWTVPWCIDCRDPYWGASLVRPDFWQDN